MAKALNKNRMLISRIALIATIIIVLLSRQYWSEKSIYHEFFEMIGVTLISLCVVGRVYSTAFIGGFKNDILVTYGIYSVLRNPLYFFSLLGITGIAFISNHILIMLFLPLSFLILYLGLIKREAEFLHEKFGTAYEEYTKKTYALIPKFTHYNAPKIMEINPKYLTKALLDAVWWLAAWPIIEFAEYLQSLHILPVLFAS